MNTTRLEDLLQKSSDPEFTESERTELNTMLRDNTAAREIAAKYLTTDALLKNALDTRKAGNDEIVEIAAPAVPNPLVDPSELLRPSVPPKTKKNTPSLKSTSGMGFDFEDHVVAYIFTEILSGRDSINDLGKVVHLKRQDESWEPFGDLVLSFIKDQQFSETGVSIKSFKTVTENGLKGDINETAWKADEKKQFTSKSNLFVALFSSPIAQGTSETLNSLLRQSRIKTSDELDSDNPHNKYQKVLNSFASPNLKASAKPGDLLKKFYFCDFDFERNNSTSLRSAKENCRNVLKNSHRTDANIDSLWTTLLNIAREIREGGSCSRSELIEKIRKEHLLENYVFDEPLWATINDHTNENIEVIDNFLFGGLRLDRATDKSNIESVLNSAEVVRIFGQSGTGKSALVKWIADQFIQANTPVLWLTADRFMDLYAKVPNLGEVLERSSNPEGLIVIDGLDDFYNDSVLSNIGKILFKATNSESNPWKIVFITQQSSEADWKRSVHPLLKQCPLRSLENIQVGELSEIDFETVASTHPDIRRLAYDPKIKSLLSNVKILDVVVSGNPGTGTSLTNEAEIAEWWWKDQVMRGKTMSPAANLAKEVGIELANIRTKSLTENFFIGKEVQGEELVESRILRKNPEGRIEFSHDLLSDWSRYLSIRSEERPINLIQGKSDCPAWMRSIKLYAETELRDDVDNWLQNVEQFSLRLKSDTESAVYLDLWLDALIFADEQLDKLEVLRDSLVNEKCRLLERLLQRIQAVATVVNPQYLVICEKFNMNENELDFPEAKFPKILHWLGVAQFLEQENKLVVQDIPVELANFGVIFASAFTHDDSAEIFGERICEIWTGFAKVLVDNCAKELDKEITGEISRSHHSAIYRACLLASSEYPNEISDLVLIASGRKAISSQTPGQIDEKWVGKYERGNSFFSRQPEIVFPIASWDLGPKHAISREFAKEYLTSKHSIELFKVAPEAACEATLAFLIEWPKREFTDSSSEFRDTTMADHHGFTFSGFDFSPPFWTKASFYQFLESDWEPALEMIVALTNFATDRLYDWWPHSVPNPSTITLKIGSEQVDWKGWSHTYSWNRDNLNTVDIVSCALMALEQWLIVQSEDDKSINPIVSKIFSKGESTALAGVLVCVGKSCPRLFCDALKPLLFDPNIFDFDLAAVIEHSVPELYDYRDNEHTYKARNSWLNRENRNIRLSEFLMRVGAQDSIFNALFRDLTTHYQDLSESTSGAKKIEMKRLSFQFEKKNWKSKTDSKGGEYWWCEFPDELVNKDAIAENSQQQQKIQIPMWGRNLITDGRALTLEEVKNIAEKIEEVTEWEIPTSIGSFESALRDPRHAKSALVAVCLKLGHKVLIENDSICKDIKKAFWELIESPPICRHYGRDDAHHDGEHFLAIAIPWMITIEPDNQDIRQLCVAFARRARNFTVQTLFQEFWVLREVIGDDYYPLLTFALKFSQIRQNCSKCGELDSETEDRVLEEKWSNLWEDNYPSEWNIEIPAKESVDQNKHTLNRASYWFDFDLFISAANPLLFSGSEDDRDVHEISFIDGLLVDSLSSVFPEKAYLEEHWDCYPSDRFILGREALRTIRSFDQERLLKTWDNLLKIGKGGSSHTYTFLSDLLKYGAQSHDDQLVLIRCWKILIDRFFKSSFYSLSADYHKKEFTQMLFFHGDRISATHLDESYQVFFEGIVPEYKNYVTGELSDDQIDEVLHFLAGPVASDSRIDLLGVMKDKVIDMHINYWKYGNRSNHGALKLIEVISLENRDDLEGNPNAATTFHHVLRTLCSLQYSLALKIQDQFA
ncbi:MAG: hypothetical protein P1V20_01420 [Verrucomicrobiales bacterium]|nr:hypothetical protein [Verrucomicrobiales bacterium]